MDIKFVETDATYLSTPHGALGTQEADIIYSSLSEAFNSTRCIRNLMVSGRTSSLLSMLSTPHGALGTKTERD